MATTNKHLPPRKVLVVFPFSSRNRTQYIIEKFFKERTDFSSVIHLTSRWARIEDFRTRLFLCIKKPIIPPASFSLKAFAAKIVQEHSQYRLISSIEQILILLKICSRVAEKTMIDPVSLAVKLKSFIKDFKVSWEAPAFDFWLAEVKRYPWKYEENKNVAIQALYIMREYQNYLEENMLVDEDDLYTVASEHLGKNNFDIVLLEGMIEFIPSQRKFIKLIAENSKRFICVYQFDEKAPFDARNMILKPNLDFLKSIVESVVVVDDKNRNEDCVVFNFASPDEEIMGIGEMIIREISENDCINWEDFLVVFPQMLSYRELVHRIFGRLKIPFCMTPGYVLSKDPSIVAVISFLDWLDAPYWWESLMSLFTSPFFSFDVDQAIEFSKHTRDVFRGIGFFPDRKWLKKWRNWNRIEDAKKMMEVKQDSLSGWSDRLMKALEEIGWKEFDIEGRRAFTDVLMELKTDILVDRKFFIRLLKSALDMTEVEKSKGYGVKVMGILDSIGLETELAFLGGATDDALPETGKTEEFFIPDRLKEKIGLNTYDLKIARERLDVYRLKSSHRKLIFSYPSKVSGRQKNKSIMIYGIKESSFGEATYISGADTIFSMKPDIEKFRRKFIKNGVLRLTVSQLDKIARCPYDFYLTYVEEIEPYRVPEIEEVPEFWGILLHLAAEKAAADFKGSVMDDACVQQQYERFCEFVNLFLKQPSLVSSKYSYRIPPFVKSFFEKRKTSVFDAFKNALKNHKGHKIIELEKLVNVRIGDLEITGKFDRIEETEDGIFEIIDFKSGKPPYIKKRYPESGDCLELGNLELVLYALMYYKFSGKKSNVFVWSLNFDESDFEIEYPHLANFLEDFEKDLNFLVKKMFDGDFRFDTKGESCYGCAFSNCCIIRGQEGE
ncbi:MAG: PD-(D/E)XK nuclease family protein [Candidatus Omnitrophica bacterium]|nr:PD-(D/E)XK nuclease family protein [Candidatus Omnitrophota bacterium]